MKIIIGLFLLLLLTPIGLLAIAYESNDDSTTYYDSGESIDYMSYVNDEKDRIRGDINEDFSLSLSDEDIDKVLTALMRESVNSSYRTNDSESAYLMSEPLVGDVALQAKTIRATFDDNIMTLNLDTAVDLGFFVYQTTLKIDIKIEDDGDVLEATLDGLRLGRLPIPAALISQITSRLDLAFDPPVGELDIDTLSFSLDRNDDYNDSDSIIATLWEYINTYELAFFTYDDEALSLSVSTSLIRVNEDSKPTYLDTMEDRYGSDYASFDGSANMTTFLQGYNISDPQDLINGIPVVFNESFINEYIEYELKTGDYNLTLGHEDVVIEHFFLNFNEEEIAVNVFIEYDGFYSNIELLMDETNVLDAETEYTYNIIHVGRMENSEKDYLTINEPLTGFIDSQSFDFGRIEDGTLFYLYADFFNQFITMENLEFENLNSQSDGLHATLTLKND